MSRLKIAFPEFKDYDQWRRSLTRFVGMCWAMAHEIWSRAEDETGLNLSSVPVMGKGHLVNVPKFIYEFVLDNYSSGNQPELELLQSGSNRYMLVPKDLPEYVLAVGSEGEMERCRKVTTSLSGQYTKDERIDGIRVKATEIEKRAVPFLATLSSVLQQATSDN